MSRSIAIASVVGGLVLAIGMLLLPFTSAPIESPLVPGSNEASLESESCGSLLGHYTQGARHDACGGAAGDRAYMVVAGIVVAALGGWTLQRGR